LGELKRTEVTRDVPSLVSAALKSSILALGVAFFIFPSLEPKYYGYLYYFINSLLA
jgi:hypothetical protein